MCISVVINNLNRSVTDIMAAMGDPGMARGAPATVLDWLNEDCWRLVLAYVPVEDIIRSERVSRQWRAIVHQYFQDVGLRVQRYEHPYSTRQRSGRAIVLLKGRSEAMDHMSGMMKLINSGVDGKDTWSKIIKKWGEYIVACECTKPQNFKVVVRYCSNLEELLVSGIPGSIEHDEVKKKTFLFNKLRRVSFVFCEILSDSFVAKFLENTTIQELVFDRNLQGITGECLSDLKCNLKSLHFNCSFSFDFDNLLRSDRLSNLTTLDLSENAVKVMRNLHLLLENTPSLECLYLDWYNDMQCDNTVLLESVSRLRRLKHVSLMRNNNVRDCWLEALGRCPRLRSVDVSVCDEVTGVGLAALCRGAGGTLAELSVAGCRQLTHEDLLACISACPNLKALNAGWATVSLRDLARELATARAGGEIPRGLRVRLHDEKAWRRALSQQAKGVVKHLDFIDLQYYPDADNCYAWMQEMRTSKRR